MKPLSNQRVPNFDQGCKVRNIFLRKFKSLLPKKLYIAVGPKSRIIRVKKIT